MRSVLLMAAGLLVATAGQAQQNRALNEQVVPITARCPGGLRVQHQPSGGATVWTVAQEDKNQLGQAQDSKGPGVHIEFTGLKNMQAVEISVSYLPAGLRTMPIEPAPAKASNTAGESKKTFVLQQEPARQLDADLLVGPAATIKRVHLVSVTFADGSVWRASSEEECSLPPALYMPVEAKK